MTRRPDEPCGLKSKHEKNNPEGGRFEKIDDLDQNGENHWDVVEKAQNCVLRPSQGRSGRPESDLGHENVNFGPRFAKLDQNKPKLQKMLPTNLTDSPHYFTCK